MDRRTDGGLENGSLSVLVQVPVGAIPVGNGQSTRSVPLDLEPYRTQAVDYLFYSGYATLAYWWAQSVAIADIGQQSAEFKRQKLETARFFFARLLPRVNQHAAGIRAGVATLGAA